MTWRDRGPVGDRCLGVTWSWSPEALTDLLLADDAEPADDEARSAWAQESGQEWDARQSLLHRTFRSGRLMGWAGCALAVPVVLGTDLELVNALVRGWSRSADELEVDQATEARERLAWDERAEEAEDLDRLCRGVELA
jgi:hypothetical protein